MIYPTRTLCSCVRDPHVIPRRTRSFLSQDPHVRLYPKGSEHEASSSLPAMFGQIRICRTWKTSSSVAVEILIRFLSFEIF